MSAEEFRSICFPHNFQVFFTKAEMGALAVRKLFNLMKGYPEKSEILEPELIIRESS